MQKSHFIETYEYTQKRVCTCSFKHLLLITQICKKLHTFGHFIKHINIQ